MATTKKMTTKQFRRTSPSLRPTVFSVSQYGLCFLSEINGEKQIPRGVVKHSRRCFEALACDFQLV